MEIVNILNDVELIKQESEIYGYCFGMEVPDNQEINLEDINKTKDAHFGVVVDGKLQATMVIFEYPMTFFKETILMGGIGFVTTYPESRNKNFIKKLFQHSFQYMKEKGYLYSALAPFNHNFYRKFGYDIGFMKKEIKIDINDLNHIKSEGYESKPISEDDLNDLVELYNKTYAKINGAKKRDVNWFKDKLCQRKKKIYLYGFYKNNILEGYLLFKIEQGKQINVSEMSYLNVDVLNNILVFLYKHRAQVKHIVFNLSDQDPFLHVLLNQRQEIRLHPGMMVRIVNIKEVLKRYDFQGSNDFTLNIRVFDQYISENEGVFEVKRKDNEVIVRKNNDIKANFEIEISVLSQLLIGYTDLETLIRVGKVRFTGDISSYNNYFKKFETIMLESF